jgi:hypothetical protein
VKVSRSKVPKANATEEAQNATDTSAKPWNDDPLGLVDDDNLHEHEETVEQDVDRLIDADSNEYVLSRSKTGVALTLDPLLIQARIQFSTSA